MSINIILDCPHCHSETIVRNGKKHNGPQNYLCKKCGKQFISDHERTYYGSTSWILSMIKIMLVRGIGIRDISIPFLSEIERGNKWPYPDTLAKIAKAFDVKTHELFWEETSSSEEQGFTAMVVKEILAAQKKAADTVFKRYLR